MAIRHLYTVLCEYVTVGRDGRPTAAGIFHNVEVGSFPATRRLGLLIGFGGDEGDPFRITLDGPDGQTIEELGKDAIDAPQALREHEQWTFHAAGVADAATFGAPGVYGISLWDGDQRVHTYPFGVLERESREADESE
jgi:hypothetical protein